MDSKTQPANGSSGAGKNTAEKHQRLIAENDALILSNDLENGQSIVTVRTAIFTQPIAEWAAEKQAEFGYDRPFAVAAIGGTGRRELTPYSDLDLAFLFEDDIQEAKTQAFHETLQSEALHGPEFRDRFGFSIGAQPFGFDDARDLEGKQLNAFLDLSPIYDTGGLTEAFRDQIRKDFDPFEHFLHVRRFWSQLREQTGAIAERIDRFDIKNDGLRLFLGGIWSLAGREFVHSSEIYERLEDPRVLEDYYFLLRLRAWIHLRDRSGSEVGSDPVALGSHPEDVMRFKDFETLGDWIGPGASDQERFEFGDIVRSRLLTARRRIASFARGVIESELRPGRRVSPGHPVALGAGGLYHAEPETCITTEDRSRAALSLLLIAQRYDLPTDPSELQTTFLCAGDWLEPVPELGQLLTERRGSCAKTFEFLAQLPGAEDRLFPGYAKFESSIDERVRLEKLTLRGPLERKKMEALEEMRTKGKQMLDEARDAHKLTDVAYDIQVNVEAALLSQIQLAAVRLAIKTKRLPVTSDDQVARDDERRSLADRFSSGFSGIPLEEYYTRCFAGAGFDPRILELTQFLVDNRGTFRKIAEAGLIDDRQVERLLESCDGDLDRLRALFVFTHADRHSWKSPAKEPTRFFNIRELYAKARMPEGKQLTTDSLLQNGGYQDLESQEILRDFGDDFFSGIYRHYAIRFGAYLLRLSENKPSTRPRVVTIREDTSVILGVMARDDRGLAASISGALWKLGVNLTQAHMFSANHHGLVLDFFHLEPVDPDSAPEVLPGPELSSLIETAIIERQHVSASDESTLPDVAHKVTLEEWRPGLHCLQAETEDATGALIYALCYKASRLLQSNIYGLTARTGRYAAEVSIYLTLPENLSLEEAQAIVEKWSQ